MKIENLYQKFNVQNSEQVKQTQAEAQKPSENTTQAPLGRREDKVELSQTAKDIKKIESVLKTTPDVRAEKVKAIKEQIEAGTYQADSKKIANAMLADLLKDLA